MNVKENTITDERIAKAIFECGVFPHLASSQADNLAELLNAYRAGGISILELDKSILTDPSAIRAAQASGLQFGFTQIKTQADVVAAKQAGAGFLATEAGCIEAAETCVAFGMPVFVGCCNRYHVDEAVHKGFTRFYFYPVLDALPSDTLSYVGDLMSTYKNAKFVIGRHTFSSPLTASQLYELENKYLLDFMRPCSILAVCLDSLSQNHAFYEEDADTLQKQATEQVRAMHGFTFGHMCLNLPESTNKEQVAEQFAAAFGFFMRDTGNTIFAGDQIEIGHGRLGDHGHIGIISICVARAIPYLENKGFQFNWGTLQTKFSRPSFIFMKNQIGGFAIHVAQYIF